ncbi:methyl-accepting chemotaxis protein [Cohnella lubricantis]|uniref:Methyl-accepting chemotaxis protein n=1 Tax=Cohnella lubricantis TaxID=2163172 RepID=A0A841TDG3_9BACL|nr:methyl-accepting chemotaxis protein [Cohnella lubricantis]MBB6677017.1 methyl-accepting chemotaxis protein [Cohnella lubricantis]MBP2119317.1 methyl-accepting chemotaxis protein [Cohnella lubricantis]
MKAKEKTSRFAASRFKLNSKLSLRSIRTKIIAAFLVISLVPLVGISIFFSTYLKDTVTDEIHAKQDAYTSSNVQAIDHTIQNYLSIQTQMVESEAIQSGDPNRIMALLNDMMHVHKDVEMYVYIDANGIGTTLSSTGVPIGETGYIKVSKQTKKPVISDILYPEETGSDHPIIVIFVPQLDENQNYSGGIICTLNPDNLNVFTNSIKVGETGFGYLVSPLGKLITYPDKAQVGKSIEEAFATSDAATLKKKLMQEATSGNFTFTSNGASMEISYDTVPTTGWRLATFAMADEMYTSVDKANRTSVILIIVVAIVVIAVALFLGLAIAKPIITVTATVKRLATGDLTPRLAIRSKDEIGELGNQMNQMVDSFTEIIDKANRVSEQLSASSEELTAASVESVGISKNIATSTQEVLNASEAQLHGSEQTSTAMVEMAHGVQRIAESSSVVAEASNSSLEEVRKGDAAIHQAVNQMKAVRESVSQSSEKLRTLETYSKQIDEVVSVITEITNQTRLLSLNASIEAARAGEQGRGFAVVANEVKKLAEQSAASADRISTMIREVQATTAQAVEAMAQEVKDVESGSELIVAAGDIFARITDAFQEISHQVQEVSAASQQMSAGTEEVTASMNEFVHMTKTSFDHTEGIADGSKKQLASMEDISASAEELSRMAQELQQSLSRFRIK